MGLFIAAYSGQLALCFSAGQPAAWRWLPGEDWQTVLRDPAQLDGHIRAHPVFVRTARSGGAETILYDGDLEAEGEDFFSIAAKVPETGGLADREPGSHK